MFCIYFLLCYQQTCGCIAECGKPNLQDKHPISTHSDVPYSFSSVRVGMTTAVTSDTCMSKCWHYICQGLNLKQNIYQFRHAVQNATYAKTRRTQRSRKSKLKT